MIEYEEKKKSSTEEFFLDTDGTIITCFQNTKDWNTEEEDKTSETTLQAP